MNIFEYFLKRADESGSGYSQPSSANADVKKKKLFVPKEPAKVVSPEPVKPANSFGTGQDVVVQPPAALSSQPAPQMPTPEVQKNGHVLLELLRR